MFFKISFHSQFWVRADQEIKGNQIPFYLEGQSWSYRLRNNYLWVPFCSCSPYNPVIHCNLTADPAHPKQTHSFLPSAWPLGFRPTEVVGYTEGTSSHTSLCELLLHPPTEAAGHSCLSDLPTHASALGDIVNDFSCPLTFDSSVAPTLCEV